MSDVNIHDIMKNIDCNQNIGELRRLVSKLNEDRRALVEILKAWDIPQDEALLILNKRLDTISSRLSIIEMEQGCKVCGAQFGENCRTQDEVGLCVSWEDFKEEEAKQCQSPETSSALII